MKILILSSSDSRGGAAKGAHRLFEALLALGEDVHMAVQLAHSDDLRIISKRSSFSRFLARMRPKLDSLVSKSYRPQRIFSTSIIPFSSLNAYIEELKPDLVNLHWVNGGFLNLKTIHEIRQPIVWSLHDSWPFTGGCHLPLDCNRFIQACGACPTLNSTKEKDLSRQIFNLKATQYQKLNLSYTAPSKWMKEQAASSSLLGNRKGIVIPNAINPKLYQKQTKTDARYALGLPLDKKIVAFGAMDAFRDDIKGGVFVKQILTRIDPTLYFCFFGSEPIELPIPKERYRFLGTLHDDLKMAEVFRAVDTLVVPSKTESFSYVTLEALCAGTPVAAFGIGGLLDLIEPVKNGYLARPFDVDDLVLGINACAHSDEFSFDSTRYTYESVAKAYFIFFDSVL